jgi:hypothetical protein
LGRSTRETTFKGGTEENRKKIKIIKYKNLTFFSFNNNSNNPLAEEEEEDGKK